MRKFFTFFAAVLFAGSMMAEEVTFVKADFTKVDDIAQASKSGISISCKGNVPSSGNYVTFTEGNTLTISSTVGNITAIDFTTSEEAYAGNIADVTGYDAAEWTLKVDNPGNKTTVRVVSIVVTVASAEGIEAPKFEPKEDYFTSSVEVSLKAAEGADIYYTLDGAEPTDASTKYEAPFTLNATTTVKAFAAKGTDTSKVASKTYTLVEPITVAKAIEEGMKLDSMGTSAIAYQVEGYVVDAKEFSLTYGNQTWGMADDAANTGSQVFQAYNCFPIEGNDTLKVLNGDKVQLLGKLKKYYDKNEKKFIIEIEKGVATFLSKAEGDHTVDHSVDTITIAEALAIGAELGDNKVSDKKYCIEGYVSFIANLYDESKKSENFWIADTKESQASSNDEGAFYVYSGQPKNEKELGLGAKVRIVTTIKKYVKSGSAIIENDKAVPVEVLEQGELVVDTISVAEAKAEALKLAQNQTGAKFYAVKGFIHKVKEGYSAQYKNASFYISDDVNDTEDDAYCYHAAVAVADSGKIAVGAYVIVTGHLMHNYYNGKSSAQIPSGSAIFTEAPAPVELEPITVAEALEIAQALTPEKTETATTTEKYAVKGYVVSVSAKYENTYYLADEAGADGVFQAFKCASVDREVAQGDLVIVTGKISNYYGEGSSGEYHNYEIIKGTLVHVSGEGIENVQLTEKAQKIMIDGAIYIIRNGKMYDVRGAQVR